VILRTALAALALAADDPHDLDDDLPVCSNKKIVTTVRRVGCTLGDGRCWSKARGFCDDYVEARLAAEGAPTPRGFVRIPLEDVRAGDVAVFKARAHYAYVEGVRKDERGRPVAVSVAEYNFGTCWIDRDLLVTDRYRLESRRTTVPVQQVDGGFLRALRAPP
jgi:hypothetical protein